MTSQFSTLSGSWFDWFAVTGYISFTLFIMACIFMSSNN